MLPEQQKIIEEFLILNRFSTQTEMADFLGIERTRYFRLLNGCEMKLSEYLAMKKAVDNKLRLEGHDNSTTGLGSKIQQDLFMVILRAKRMQQIVKKSHLARVI